MSSQHIGEERTVTEQLVGALTAAWRAIQDRHPEVPDVVLTLGSGTLGQRGTLRLGHFAQARWYRTTTDTEPDKPLPELFIGGEGLRRGAEGVLATLLHEAAHGLAATRGIQDTSREGRYHNRRYKTLAEELGLHVDEDGTRGWSATQLTPATQADYATVLDQLADAITTYRRAENPSTPTPKSRNNIVAVCQCPRRVRVARAVLSEAPIICGACGGAFTPEDD